MTSKEVELPLRLLAWEMEGTLDSPITVGHNNFLEPALIIGEDLRGHH
jgi:hypothetical protein